MKNNNFFYLQYDKINWQNQEKTKINFFVNKYIINNIISEKGDPNIKVFDIGFGIGFFLKILHSHLKYYQEITLAGCEPSEKNFNYYLKNPIPSSKKIKIITEKSTFLRSSIEDKFDFITAIYVFPHFVFDDLEKTVIKINSMLNEKGKLILVVANENYLKNKLKSMKDLFIENNIIDYKNKKYKEYLHYSEIPEIGKVIDYNREDKFYIDLFNDKGFKLNQKENLDDNGFICSVFVFEKS